MVLTFLNWLYIFFLSFCFGFTVLRFFFSARSSDTPPFQSPLSLIVLAGLASLSCLVVLFSFGLNLGLVTNLILTVAALVLLFLQRKSLLQFFTNKFQSYRRFSPFILLLFTAIFLVALAKTGLSPQNYDTGLYHAQAIRWAETYPVVPGLGNLHDRLAFDSTWLVLSALFSLSFLGLQSFHALGGFLVVCVCGYLLGKFDRLIHGEITLTAIISILMIFLIRWIFPLEYSSPGTDLPAALLVWVIFLISMEKVEKGSTRLNDGYTLLITLLSCYVLTIKLSVFPILLLPLFFWICSKKRFQISWLLIQAGLAVLIFIPWMARNVVLSGYLVYPVAEVNLFNPDWKIPLTQAKNTETSIRAWARNETNGSAVLKAPIKSWILDWYSLQDSADRQLLWGSVLSGILFLCAMLAYLLHFRRAPPGASRYLVFYLVALLGLGYWFYEAPALRFGYGFIGISLCLLLAPLIQGILQHLGLLRKVVIPAIVIVLILYQAVGIYNQVRDGSLLAHLVRPDDYHSSQTAENQIGNTTIYTTTHGDQCWYDPFPCAPALPKNLTLRGFSLKDGFRIEK